MNGEKPYDFVPFPKGRPDRKQGAGQDKLDARLLSGTLELTLCTLTPVHVGLGYSDFIKAGNQEYLAALQASKPVRENDAVRRRYLIPGSSIKGAVRSIVEAITRSCIRITQSRHRPYIPQGYGGCMSVNDLCIACRLFGAQGYQGHVSFEDAVAPKGSLVLLGTPLLWTPARGGRGLPPRYLDRNHAKGRKFYRHASPPSGADPRACIKSRAELPLRIHFLNLSEAELGVLLTALGLHPKHSFPIKLGGGKPVGLGSVQVTHSDHPFPIKLGEGKPVGLGSVQVTRNQITLLQGADALKKTGRLGRGRTLVKSDLSAFIERAPTLPVRSSTTMRSEN